MKSGGRGAGAGAVVCEYIFSASGIVCVGMVITIRVWCQPRVVKISSLTGYSASRDIGVI